MKKELLAGTVLVGAAAILGGAAVAAEAPTWKLTGNANFQFYYVDQDYNRVESGTEGTWSGTWPANTPGTGEDATEIQDHGWYFGVDEAELQLNVSGTADNGLNYGFKIELNANTTDGKMADEARLQLSGGWGTLQMGDEDGAEDIMNYGGENLMGAT
ncbi:MAG: porin, partial [Proteobacteria bacterium]|nr:porin [Pseudomonadota bacterium]